jgi:hypothetical protein
MEKEEVGWKAGRRTRIALAFVAVVIGAQGALAYTIETQTLLVRATVVDEIQDTPVRDTDEDTATGTGELTASAHAVILNGNGSVRRERFMTAETTLSAGALRLDSVHEGLSNGGFTYSGNTWSHTWDIVFEVTDATPFSLDASINAFDYHQRTLLYDLDRGVAIFDQSGFDQPPSGASGTLAPGRYRLLSDWGDAFGYGWDGTHTLSMVLTLVPEPGTATLVALALVGIAAARRRRV